MTDYVTDCYGARLEERWTAPDGSTLCELHQHWGGWLDGERGYVRPLCRAHHPNLAPLSNGGEPFCVTCGAGLIDNCNDGR